MKPRNPPRLATWLWNRAGLAHQNPPLAGDLLEEFHAGRSTAWFWRQTLRAILTGLGRHARQRRWSMAGLLTGWATEVGVTFTLKWHHFPSTSPYIFGALASVALLLWIVWEMLRRKRYMIEPEETEDEPGFRYAMSAFAVLLTSSCLFWILRGLPLGRFIFQQAWYLVCSVVFQLVPKSNRIQKL